jgi:multidrug efflux pump subunit AcrA (membrane-fusion protein)
MKRTLKWLGGLVLLVLLISAAFYGYQRFFAVAGPERNPRGNQNNREANTVLVKKGEIIKAVSAFGDVYPTEEAVLHFKTSGTLKETVAKIGDHVEAGQILAKLSNSQQELLFLQATNAYEAAKISAPTSEVKVKELEYQIAQEGYESTFLKAPFAGEITEIHVREGDYVSANTDIISLMDRSEMFIQVDTDEVDIGEISLGQKAQATFEAYPELQLSAEVTSIGYRAVAKGSTKIIQVTLKLLKSDPKIKPGFSAKAQIVVASVKDALQVPVSSITNIRGKHFVMLVKDTGTESVQVEVGLMTEEIAQIISGLKEGDRILAVNSARSNANQRPQGNTNPFSPFGVPGR